MKQDSKNTFGGKLLSQQEIDSVVGGFCLGFETFGKVPSGGGGGLQDTEEEAPAPSEGEEEKVEKVDTRHAGPSCQGVGV